MPGWFRKGPGLAVLLAFCVTGRAGAAELELMDDLRVDGYSQFTASAAVQGNSFIVGGSTFSVRYGRVGIGTAAPSFLMHVSSSAGVSGDLLVISTGSSNVIRMNGKGEVYASRYFGDVSHAGNLPSGSAADSLGSHVATETLKMGGFAVAGAGAGTFGGALTVNGSSLTVTGKDASGGYSLVLSSGVSMPAGTLNANYLNAGAFKGDGSRLTALNASALDSGTAADARLSSNVDLLNATQTVSGVKTFSSSATITEGRGLWSSSAGLRAGVSVSSAAAAQGGGIQVSSNVYVNGYIRSVSGGFTSVNAALGVTPTLAGTWTTSPTSLGNVTDGSFSTVSGTGASTKTGTFLSYLKIDLGANYRGLMYLTGSAWSSATGSVAHITIGFSQDAASNYWTATTFNMNNTTSEWPVTMELLFSGRYLTIHCWTGNSGITAYCKFTELVAAIYQ